MAQVWLVDKYGARVVKLERQERNLDDGYYVLPESAMELLLDVGDVYRVESFDDDGDER